ncbi:radical SAM/SPASM domain-containing protein [Methanoculleus chikugoensis]|uniref:Radical SAM protein n=1 Tax=Methanoculleus chikugoensis TaxID=118126 RepID=A0ABN5XHM0_9EURY|nr:radical SAM protein [Methanoculleus chikugoensis]BBL68200.1 radical SAM protein [Methanoculleus chikugoensis]
MIRFTRLVHGEGPVSGRAASQSALALAESRSGPVVFWNVTSRCNLACTHCYLRSGPGRRREDELTTDEATALIDDLARAGVPLLLFSGGEPLVREDFWTLAAHARRRGLPAVLSTNGTLITPAVARRLRDAGIGYAGISLDGATAATHDAFRGVPGSFDRSVQALQNCIDAGLRCGVRFTVTKRNHNELGDLIALARSIGVHRFCVYWLVPTGRGGDVHADLQVAPGEVRAVLDRIYHETLRTDPATMEFLTVDAPQDGACLLARLEADAHPAYDRVYRLLTRTAGCSAGRRVANIAPSGNVYPCQFAQFEEFLAGNVRNRPFGEIWNDPENPVLAAFRADGTRTGSPCSTCGRREVCGTGCRVRAYIRSGDLNGGDPLCLRHG